MGITNKVKTFVRESVSPRLTSIYGKAGFVNRNLLNAHLSTLTSDNHGLLIDKLIDKGIIKESFRHDLSSLDQLRPYMLTKTISVSATTSPELRELDGVRLTESNNRILSSVVQGTMAGYHSVTNFMSTNEGLSLSFSLGAKAAKGIALTLGVGGAIWFAGIPTFSTTALVLGATTAACVLAAKLHDHLPTQGYYGKFASALRFVSKLGVAAYAADGFYLANLVYQNNQRITGIFDSLGLESSLGLMIGLGLGINHFVKSKLAIFNRSFSGQLDPGEKKGMGSLVNGATYSSAAEIHYLGTRLLLLGGATAYMAVNIVAASAWGFIPLTIPLLGIGTAAYLRTQRTYDSKKEDAAKKAAQLDFLKIYTPYIGLVTGVAAAGIASLATWSLIPAFAFGTFYGSLATFFISELHGSFHSLNTNFDMLSTMKTSSRDVIGEAEKRELSDPLKLELTNPHTGLKEHTYGLLFSAILSRKPGLNYKCMYDLVLSALTLAIKKDDLQTKVGLSNENFQKLIDSFFIEYIKVVDKKNVPMLLLRPDKVLLTESENAFEGLKTDGTLTSVQTETIKTMLLSNRKNHEEEKAFIGKVKEFQSNIYKKLHDSINPQAPLAGPSGRYQQLIDSLTATAEYFDKGLLTEIETLIAGNKGWFENKAALAEYLRAAFAQVALRAEEFRKEAQILQRKLANNYVSETEFRKEWERHLRCYDPDYVTIFPVARKNVAGDERMVRKVENVASGALQRGITIYKGTFKETPNDRHPAEDWVAATWSRVPNPIFWYKAEEGTLQAAKFIWVPSELLMTKVQKENSDSLSTSSFVEKFDNNPAGQAGFAAGENIKIKVNDQEIEVRDFYYVKPGGKMAQDTSPFVVAPVIREEKRGKQETEKFLEDYKYFNADPARNPEEIMQPFVIINPAYDYSTMMDKNDIQLYTYSLFPALLERAKKDIVFHLMIRYPLEGKYEFINPYPDKEIDPDKNLEVIDGSIELSYEKNRNQSVIIPFKLDRGAAHAGINESVNWQSFDKAVVTVKGHQVVGFALVYNELDPQNYKKEPWSKDTEKDHWPKSKDTASIEYLKKFKAITVPLPPRDWPVFLSQLNLDLSQDRNIDLKVNNFMKAPRRDGNMSWIKIHYLDRTIGFVRTPDGIRPILNNY